MNKEITYEITDNLFLQSYDNILGKRNFLLFVYPYFAIAGFCVILTFAFNAYAGIVGLIIAGTIFAFFSAWYWIGYFQGKKSGLEALSKYPHRLQTHRFADTQFLADSSVGQTILTWEMLERVEIFDELWLLQFLGAQFWIPSALIDEELASFIEAKAKARGIHFIRNGISSLATTAKRKPVSGSPTFWVLLISLTLTFLLWNVWDTPRNDPKEENFVVEPGKSKILPIRARSGDSIDISLDVVFGAAVDVSVGWQVEADEKKVTIRSANLIEETQIWTLHRKEIWAHATPPVIIVSSKNRSEIVLKVEVSRAKQ